MLRDLTPQALMMGVLAAFVGYAASFAIVLAGLAGVGASPAQAATGLFFASLGMGLASLVLPLVTRTPAAVAWSTPGAAFLAAGAALPGGFAEAVGALILCAGLLFLTGIVPALGRIVGAIPKPLASALLAGVLFRLCLAPALGLASDPWLVAPVIAAWALGLAWHRMAAMPLAVAAFLAVLAFGVDVPAASGPVLRLPELAPVAPLFTWNAALSVALPLYLVTMAGQNIPGFAVLDLNGYPVNRGFLLKGTGLVSLGIAPFGAVPVNMSAITAAMMAGPDAGADPARRYWAAVVSGGIYCALALAAGAVAALAVVAPAALITGVAGLALIPAFVAAMRAAFAEGGQTEAPAVTFLVVASGMAAFGIGGAVWGLGLGAAIWTLTARARR
ncbi:MAG: benzoate transporter [Rhodobacteraceae bacterium]|nr:MAG: benzoate transporter [Paracoccaceae bacterium]